MILHDTTDIVLMCTRDKCDLRWLNKVFYKMENSRFRSVFLDCYYLVNNKEYHTGTKQRLKGSNFFTELKQMSLIWQRFMAFFDFKAI